MALSGLNNVGLENLKSQMKQEETFDQINELSNQCRFKDCTHVMETLDEGIIQEVAYENYLKLRSEDAYMEAKTDQMAYLEKKAQDKKLHKQVRNIYNSRRPREQSINQ